MSAPNESCCGAPCGTPHAEDCQAVAEVRRQDAEYRADLEWVTDEALARMDEGAELSRVAPNVRVIPGAAVATEDAL